MSHTSGSTMKGKGGRGKENESFHTEGWLEEVGKPIDEEYYHPGEEGLARNLLDDVGEILEDDVEEVKEAVTAVGDTVDAVDIVGETVDDVMDAVTSAYCSGVDDVSDKVPDAAEVAIETMADVAGDVVALVTGFISYEVVEEVAEGMIDVIPKYGLCVGVLRLVWGLVYAVTRMASWRQARRSEP